jgi:crotonobetainyl-CoA:carnitine CoA-transferase CaiB-like acyl-CoA transferase
VSLIIQCFCRDAARNYAKSILRRAGGSPASLWGKPASDFLLAHAPTGRPAAPHGVYPCLGEDRWLAIARFTEAEWRALTGVAGHPEWTKDQRFVDLTARLKHQEALDALVGGWPRSQEAHQVMYNLQ